MRAMATLAAALCVSLCTATAQDRPANDEAVPPATEERGGWLPRWLSFGRGPEKKPAVPAKKPAGVRASSREARERELAAYHRRLEVCLKLREIAVRTRDGDLLRKADDLEQMVWETYMQRTSHLPASAATSDPDEQLLTQRLGPTASDGRALSAGPTSRERTTGLAERKE